MIDYDLSASRIKRHAKCPEQYRLRYVEGKEPTKQKKGYGELGSLVHESIENVLGENPEERDRKRLTGLLKQEFYELEESDEYDKSIIDENQRSTGIDCLEMAAKFISKQDFELEAIEKMVSFEIDEIDRTNIGFIDVVTTDGIWDWKTGTIRDSTGRDEVIQGSVYMAGYHNEYGELPDYIRFVYLKEGKVREIEPSQMNWNKMLKYARKLVNSERKGEFSPDPEQSKCYFCDWEYFCTASDVSPGKVNEAMEKGQTELWGAI